MKIVDEFTDRDDLSRAMKCILRKRKAGKCRTGGCHGKPVEGGFCKQCAIDLYHKRREKRPTARAYNCRAIRFIEEDEVTDPS